MARRRKQAEDFEPVTPAQFIEIWQSSASVAQVARRARCTKGAVRRRAYRYRKLGIPLKQFEPPLLPDWDWLKEYAQSLLPKGAQGDGDIDWAGGEARPA
jgi:hypothetical protein